MELCALCGEIPDMKEKAKKISVFPTGDKLPEMFSTYFIGQAYLAPYAEATKEVEA